MRIINNIDIITYAESKYVKISPIKLQPSLNLIKNKYYFDALKELKKFPSKKYLIIWKCLKSCINNAIYKFNLEKNNIFIYDATCTKGPTLKRIRPGARGKAFPIRKVMSHLIIKVI